MNVNRQIAKAQLSHEPGWLAYVEQLESENREFRESNAKLLRENVGLKKQCDLSVAEALKAKAALAANRNELDSIKRHFGVGVTDHE